jgi:predicted SprT family Zn-dependent metalloprotease
MPDEMHANAITSRELVQMTRELLDEHGVDGFDVKMNGRLTRAIGRTNFTMRVIEFSSKLAAVNDRSILENTVRHEVAHAIAGFKAKHGPEWKAACRLTGAEPVPCVAADSIEGVGRWEAWCTGCKKKVDRRQRKPKSIIGWNHQKNACDGGGGEIRWVDNERWAIRIDGDVMAVVAL